jgi:type II secretory pathway pseudopilin PulG
MRRAGAILLELLLSIAILVAAGMAILGLVAQVVAGLQRSRDAQHAADLVRSAISRMEAGIAMPEALAGPVEAWEPAGADDAFDDAPPAPGGWELEIDTQPTPFRGLTRVAVRALRRDSRTGRTDATFEIVQLVRLGPDARDEIGPEDDLTDLMNRRRAGAGGLDRSWTTP